jgi:hypothetical protein
VPVDWYGAELLEALSRDELEVPLTGELLVADGTLLLVSAELVTSEELVAAAEELVCREVPVTEDDVPVSRPLELQLLVG